MEPDGAKLPRGATRAGSIDCPTRMNQNHRPLFGVAHDGKKCTKQAQSRGVQGFRPSSRLLAGIDLTLTQSPAALLSHMCPACLWGSAPLCTIWRPAEPERSLAGKAQNIRGGRGGRELRERRAPPALRGVLGPPRLEGLAGETDDHPGGPVPRVHLRTKLAPADPEPTRGRLIKAGRHRGPPWSREPWERRDAGASGGGTAGGLKRARPAGQPGTYGAPPHTQAGGRPSLPPLCVRPLLSRRPNSKNRFRADQHLNLRR